jgi:hypothetical protein
MTAKFRDLQDSQNPLNGSLIRDEYELERLFNSLSGRKPFFCQLRGENGYTLLVGVGLRSCVEYALSNGDPPYWEAVGMDVENESDEEVKFMAGDTATPVPIRHIIPFSVTVQIAEYFLRSGERSPIVKWEQI